jgi:hypothetical protein
MSINIVNTLNEDVRAAWYREGNRPVYLNWRISVADTLYPTERGSLSGAEET